MTHNISEYVRLQEELDFYKAAACNVRYPKSERENALVRVRELEKRLGIESKPYNSNEF